MLQRLGGGGSPQRAPANVGDHVQCVGGVVCRVYVQALTWKYSVRPPLRNLHVKKLRRAFRPPAVKKPARALSSHLQTTLHQENFGVFSAKMAKILEKSRAARAQGW